jgi:hypothetical protein
MSHYSAFVFLDPTQTLADEFDLWVTDTGLCMGQLTYPWAKVVVVDAVGSSEDESLMPHLDVTILGVGQFVMEIDEALEVKMSCRWYMGEDESATSKDYDSTSTFQHEGEGGVLCKVEHDNSRFLPGEAVLLMNESGLFVLPKELNLRHSPLVRLDILRIDSAFESDDHFGIDVHGLGEKVPKCTVSIVSTLDLYKTRRALSLLPSRSALGSCLLGVLVFRWHDSDKKIEVFLDTLEWHATIVTETLFW